MLAKGTGIPTLGISVPLLVLDGLMSSWGASPGATQGSEKPLLSFGARPEEKVGVSSLLWRGWGRRGILTVISGFLGNPVDLFVFVFLFLLFSPVLIT